jgi:serine O-acetyltransferase
MNPSEFFYHQLLSRHQNCSIHKIDRDLLNSFLLDTIGLLFPQFQRYDVVTHLDLLGQATSLEHSLAKLVKESRMQGDFSKIGSDYLDFLPKLLEILKLDAEAIFAGDPAARSVDEVVICYPGFFAIAAYRLAHFLHELGLPIIPRALTEFAHERTGIDIHPGAKIGHSFCIDHGTGIVIGETSVVGDNVKIFQGVTLGGLSVDKSMVNQKRHPTIEDNVVLYGGAKVFGGETVVGKGSVIGGNVWLTKSVPPNSKVYYQASVIVRAQDEED